MIQAGWPQSPAASLGTHQAGLSRWMGGRVGRGSAGGLDCSAVLPGDLGPGDGGAGRAAEAWAGCPRAGRNDVVAATKRAPDDSGATTTSLAKLISRNWCDLRSERCQTRY